MGLFDTVHFRCPSCNTAHEIQSKAGECILQDFEANEVPSKIAADLDGERVSCKSCLAEISLRLEYRPRLIVSIEGG